MTIAKYSLTVSSRVVSLDMSGTVSATMEGQLFHDAYPLPPLEAMKCVHKNCQQDPCYDDAAWHMQLPYKWKQPTAEEFIKQQKCEVCHGTGWFKSNTMEFEGGCPNGCCFHCGHGKEYHQHADACRFENCQCERYE